jgi:hypothetical protein
MSPQMFNGASTDPIIAWEGEYREIRREDGSLKLEIIGSLVPIRASERKKLSAQFQHECEGSHAVRG